MTVTRIEIDHEVYHDDSYYSAYMYDAEGTEVTRQEYRRDYFDELVEEYKEVYGQDVEIVGTAYERV